MDIAGRRAMYAHSFPWTLTLAHSSSCTCFIPYHVHTAVVPFLAGSGRRFWRSPIERCKPCNEKDAALTDTSFFTFHELHSFA